MRTGVDGAAGARAGGLAKVLLERTRLLARTQDGGLAIFALFIFVIMLAAAGLAIDTMRAERERVRLQATLDGALLAAADLQQALPPEDVVRSYFAAAGLSDRLDADSIVVEERVGRKAVSARARFDVPTLLLGLVGVDALAVGADGRAAEIETDVEISLVLDISGSMQSTPQRIDALRPAARSFIDTVMQNGLRDDGTARTTMSIVPYSTSVSLPEEMYSLYNVNAFHDRSRCILFRDADYDDTALNRTIARDQLGHFLGDDRVLQPDRSEPGYRYDVSPRRVFQTDCPRVGRDNGGVELNTMVPFETDPEALKASIDTLAPYGTTAMHVGMRWGVALLDPTARPVADSLVGAGAVEGAASGRPFDYRRADTVKAVVLMTDGEITGMYDLFEPFKRGLSNVWYDPVTKRHSFLLRGRHVAQFPYDRRAQRPEAPCADLYRNELWTDGKDYSAPAVDGIIRTAASGQDDRCEPVWYWIRDHDWRLPGYKVRVNDGRPTGPTSSHPYSQHRDDPARQNDWDTLGSQLERLTYAELFDRFTSWDFTEFLYSRPRKPTWISWQEWALREGRREVHTPSRSAQLFLRMCDAAKAQGIVIFTMGMELASITNVSERTEAQNLLKSCATSPNHHYETSRHDLDGAFQSIAARITQLRLTR